MQQYKVILLTDAHFRRLEKLIETDTKNRAYSAAQKGYTLQSKQALEKIIVPIELSQYVSPLQLDQLIQNLQRLRTEYNTILQKGTQALKAEMSQSLPTH